MLEAEIKPLVTLVRRRREVLQSLVISHRFPFLVPLLIAEDVVGLDQ